MATKFIRHEKLTPLEQYGRQIFKSLFEASVPYKDSMSPEYIKLYGMPTVGDPVFDREMHDQPHITYMTIDKMVEYFKRGVNVSVLRHEDTKRIYDIVDGYLNEWRKLLEEGINVGGAPVEDLLALDRFAEVVYPFAQQHRSRADNHSRWAAYLSGGGQWKSRDDLMQIAKEKTEEVQSVHPQRESMASLFSERVVYGARRQGAISTPDPMAPMPKERWQRQSGG